MNHHKYLGVISLAGLISWISWIVVIFKLNVYESPGLSLGLFFLSLFFALVATFTVIGFYFRVWFYKNEIYYNHINVALRQGILLTLISLGCLVFQMLHILTWWSGLLLIGIVTLVEFYAMTKEQ